MISGLYQIVWIHGSVLILCSCPGKDQHFCFLFGHLLSLTKIAVRIADIQIVPTMTKILSSHWTFPPFPETFMCLFLVGVFILQYLFQFVNCFLKFYLFFYYYLSDTGRLPAGSPAPTYLFYVYPSVSEHRRRS